MKYFLFIFSLLTLASCSTFTKSKIDSQNDYSIFVQNVKNGTGHLYVKNYLNKNQEFDLLQIADTALNLNIIQLIVFPKIIEPIYEGNELKSDKDILMMFEVFLNERRNLDSLIVTEGLKSLIRYNDYLYSPITYNFLSNRMKNFRLSPFDIIESDAKLRDKWQLWECQIRNCSYKCMDTI